MGPGGGLAVDTEDDDDGAASDSERDAPGPRMDLLSGMLAVQPASPTIPNPRFQGMHSINALRTPPASSLSGSVMHGVWDMSCQEEDRLLNGILSQVVAKRAQLTTSRAHVNSSLSDVEERKSAAIHRSVELRRRRQECDNGIALAAAAGTKEALLLAQTESFRSGRPPLQAVADRAADSARSSSNAKRNAMEVASSTAATMEILREKRRALDRQIEEETVRGMAADRVVFDANVLSLQECSAAEAATAAVNVWDDGGKKADESYASYKRDNDAVNRDMQASNITLASEFTFLEGADGEECKRDALSVKTLASSRNRLSKLHQSLLQWGANPTRSGSCSASTSTTQGARSGVDAMMFANDSGLSHVHARLSDGDVCSAGTRGGDGGSDPFGGNLLFDGSDDALFGTDMNV